MLILSQHQPLSPEDQAWLVGKCRAWSARFDGCLAAIEVGGDSRTVRDQADETANNLVGRCDSEPGACPEDPFRQAFRTTCPTMGPLCFLNLARQLRPPFRLRGCTRRGENGVGHVASLRASPRFRLDRVGLVLFSQSNSQAFSRQLNPPASSRRWLSFLNWDRVDGRGQSRRWHARRRLWPGRLSPGRSRRWRIWGRAGSPGCGRLWFSHTDRLLVRLAPHRIDPSIFQAVPSRRVVVINGPEVIARLGAEASL